MTKNDCTKMSKCPYGTREKLCQIPPAPQATCKGATNDETQIGRGNETRVKSFTECFPRGLYRTLSTTHAAFVCHVAQNTRISLI